ncbi:FHA domain-containing protein [Mycobacterium sp. E2733]|uniref:ATP-binding cassette domain-containing protein n=1 Tax=Mycobacterium sp. E2733 TaxID=1834138 RepID=UPI0007FC8ED6|nr:FHA domain-containing protein [Mycobacterium sp. E2733]OBH97362.1 ABC transporter ATP-binding protein [Mycobacterium sp. E2733]
MPHPPGPPVLTIRCDGSEHSFAAGHDVVIGRDVRADMRVTHPMVSRAHLLVRFDQGKWWAIDNSSLNGVFVNGQRVPNVDIHDGQSINLGMPDGPRVTFEVAHHKTAGRPPKTMLAPLGALRGVSPPSHPQPAYARVDSPPGSGPQPAPPRYIPPAPPRPPYPPSGPQRQPGYPSGPSGPQPVSAPPSGPQPVSAPPPPPPTQVSQAAAKVANLLRVRAEPEAPTGSVTIGRASDNNVVIQDVLASRHHAFMVLTPKGTEIRDLSSVNGTFVNGARVESAVLTEGDVVTIGNVDLVYTQDTLVRRTEAATRTGGLEVQGVDFTVEHDRKLLHNISLTARPGTFTAIIGGSGTGKSTLARLIAGLTQPSAGTVTFEGHNVHSEYAILRSRIGMVPQDDVVHRQLTVNQALGYAAELRLPPDTSKADQARVIAQVLEELELTKHADSRVDKLSGGQRKRASVALELLTGPSLLILDEPTSGLDPALDRQVMLMLRHLADAGRVVLVVTHSLTYLDVCDHVLLLAPGGKTAFDGPPDQIGQAMGTTNWADIFAKVGDDPDAANQRFLAQNRPPPLAVSAAQKAAELGPSVRTSTWRQVSTIARRQVRLVVADRAYFAFLALLPFILGSLALIVPGTKGFGSAEEAQGVLNLLTMAAVFMGTALTIRDLIGERSIFQREQAVGLSTSAYLLAKIAVFCAFAVAEAAIATTVAIVGKGAPTEPAVLLGNATLELYVTVAAACAAATMVGLLLSSLARSSEQIMPLLVVSLMVQLVLGGAMVPVTGRAGLDQASWAMPSRWGYAASASTVDILKIDTHKIFPQDSHFKHTPGAWLFDMAMLALLSMVYAGFVRWRIRLKR